MKLNKRIIILLMMFVCSAGMFAEEQSGGTPSAMEGSWQYQPRGDQGGEQGGGQGDSGNQEVGDAEDAAKKATDEAAEAVKELTQLENEITELEKKIEDKKQEKEKADACKELHDSMDMFSDGADGGNKTSNLFSVPDSNQVDAELAAMEQQLAELKKKEAAAKQNANEKLDKMRDAYSELAAVYEKYGITGDPVDVSTGNYIARYEDFIAQDYLSKFVIKRNRTEDSWGGSFGKNWTCQLDSRLVWLYPVVDNELQDYAGELGSLYSEAYQKINDYRKKFPKYISEELESKTPEFLKEGLFYNWYYLYLTKQKMQESIYKIVDSKIKFGKYADEKNRHSEYPYIVLIDDEGRENYLFNSDDTTFLPVNSNLPSKFKLKIEEGEYCVEYSDGRKRYYDMYGVLKSDKDRNGNEVKYVSTDGSISSIILKTGEVLTVSRNSEGLITKISGPVSGEAVYSYSGGRLKSVTDNSNINVVYEYDSEGYITEIKKADGNKISLSYKSENNQKKVCSVITNENGQTEQFSYDFQKKTVRHTDITDLTEIFELTENGLTEKYTDGKGNTTSFVYGENNQISSIKKNGKTRTIEYNAQNHPVKSTFSNGGVQTVSYNSFGQITSVTDCDGFSNQYIYDTKGNIVANYFCMNLINSESYYQNGLLRELNEDNIKYEYVYNNFGSVTKRTVSWPGNMFEETFVYDSKNRIVSEKRVSAFPLTYTYDGSTISVTEGKNKKKTYKYNSRGWISEVTQEDLMTGKSFSLRYVYDGRGNVIKVFLNGKEYVNLSYNKFGHVQEITVKPVNNSGANQKTQTIKCTYDSYGYLTSETVISGNESIQKYSILYSHGQNQTVVKIKCGNEIVCTYYYDADEKLVKLVKQDGYTKNYTYSKAGRILSETDTNGVTISYKYKTDGSKSVEIQKSDNSKETYSYDAHGNLVQFVDGTNQKYSYTYDIFGKLINETGPYYQKSYSYGINDRLESQITKDKTGNVCYSKKYIYDDSKRTKKVYEGNILVYTDYYDAWNRVTKRNSIFGDEQYEYDWAGNVIKKTDAHGNVIEYEYSVSDNLLKKTGLVEEDYEWNAAGKLTGKKVNGKQEYSAIFDLAGRITDEVNEFGAEQKYSYDSNGLLSSIYKYDTGTISFNTQIKEKKIMSSDANGNMYLYETGCDGRIVKETDSLGKSHSYQYDAKGRIVKIESSDGHVVQYEYTDSENKFVAKYDNGEKVEVCRNAIDKVLSIKSENGNIEFQYDNGGRLIKSLNRDISIGVEYGYDNLGRCVSKKSDNFNYRYEYDQFGNITNLKDLLSGASVAYEYDRYDRIVREKYSNGMNKSYEYDQDSRIKSVVSKNKMGMIIKSDYLVYDSKGRICETCGENDCVWKYEYDERGRLVRFCSPYSDEQCSFAKKEAEECGVGIKSERPEGVVVVGKNPLDERKITQYSWFEEYEYTESGNILSVKNPFGKIVYEYDKMNRLVAKHGSNSNGDGGIKFFWNDDNCLERILSGKKEIVLKYGNALRPVLITSKSFENGNVFVCEYEYDCLGRRIKQIQNGVAKCYVYDRLTNEILVSTEVTDNGRVLAKENGAFLETEVIGQGKYKLVDERMYSEYGNSETKNTDSRPSSTLYCFGRPVFNTYVEGSVLGGYQSEFILIDYRGSVCGTFDEDGNCVSLCDYDIWGNVLKSGKNESYGNSVQRLNVDIQILDLGKRDYVPSIKIFTTMDPARDGGNWFAYCTCDPVNYVDESGMEKKSMTKSQNAKYNSKVAEFGKYNMDNILKDGVNMGIPNNFDCADVASTIDKIASDAAGYETNSEMQKKFNRAYDNGDNKGAKGAVGSSSYNTDGWEENVRKTGTKEDKNNPDVVTPGTLIVFKDDLSTDKHEGHVVVVVAVDYDESGNVVGVAYIEGHTKYEDGSGNPTEVGYMTMGTDGYHYKDYIYDLDAWKGIFDGFYEIENANSSCGK